MKKFEYKSFNIKLNESTLNKLGEEGWELVSHSAVMNNHQFSQYYVFKREKKI